MKLYEIEDIGGETRRPAWLNISEIQMAEPSWMYVEEPGGRKKKETVYVTLRKGGIMVSPEDWRMLMQTAGIEIVRKSTL